MAERAWFCVEAATFRWVAKYDKDAVTSAAPMMLGWRLPSKMMKRRTH